MREGKEDACSVTDVIATGAADARAHGYLEAERGLWNYYGLTARERFIEVGPPAARLRVLEQSRERRRPWQTLRAAHPQQSTSRPS
jgi:hypothetical protein